MFYFSTRHSKSEGAKSKQLKDDLVVRTLRRAATLCRLEPRWQLDRRWTSGRLISRDGPLWSAVYQKNCHPVGAVWKIHTKNTSTTKGKGNCHSVASGLQQTLLLGIFFFFSTPDPSASRAALICLSFVFLPSVSFTVSKQNILLYNLKPLRGFTSYSS